VRKKRVPKHLNAVQKNRENPYTEDVGIGGRQHELGHIVDRVKDPGAKCGPGRLERGVADPGACVPRATNNRGDGGNRVSWTWHSDGIASSAVIVGFSRTGGGHNHRQGSTFAPTESYQSEASQELARPGPGLA